MNLKRLTLLLAVLCCGLPFTSGIHAATTTMTDQEVVKFLSPADVIKWNAAQKQLTQANADLVKGNKLAQEQPDPSAMVKQDIAGDHAKGNQMVKDANNAKNNATKILSPLRTLARENRNKTLNESQITAELRYAAPVGQWPEAVVSMSKAVFTELTELKYKKVYLAGVYALDKDGKYVAKPELAAQVRQQLTALDKNKIYSAKNEGAFKIGQDGSKLIITYPDRAADQSGNPKVAAIVGEVLFESRSGYAAVSLRAVDLSNMRAVVGETMMLSVEPSMAKMLGLTLAQVPSKRIPPPAADPAAKNKEEDAAPPPVTVNLQDPSNVLGKSKVLKTSLGVASAGRGDTLANRFATLMLKSYFLDLHNDLKTPDKDLKISDIDFLTLALPDEKPDVTAKVPADLSAVFMVPNVDDLSAAITLDPLKTRDISAGAETSVGKLTIERNLPKLTLPSIEDLHAGGYGN